MTRDRIADMAAEIRRLSATCADMRVALVRVDPAYRAALAKAHCPGITVESDERTTQVHAIGPIDADGRYQSFSVAFDRMMLSYGYDMASVVHAGLEEPMGAMGIDRRANRVVVAVLEGRNEVIPL